ncbi:DEKNAAC105367 [Brettanomyces naardenensis]|uniref:UDP-N-acetylglucosamine diphosphorylase n=1 Tax=Brettanomyces naardenensis TaxID=13370 RepID=A0A448YT69_BRENA|nr:DEKNAAC105367 [Brettanomyces naardenensis]
MTMTQSIDVKQAYIDAGQQHLFKYWESLSKDEQDTFLKQLSTISNPSKFLADVQKAIQYSSSIAESKVFEPLPRSICYSSILEEPKDTLSEWSSKGLELIANNKVAIILMAGGQGSRLGSSTPKGIYDVGLPSHKSMFQLQCERILKLKRLTAKKFGKAESDVRLPMYIMTSLPTRAATEKFFTEHDNFGLGKDVIFFNQGILPAVTMDGKNLLLGSKSSLVESPDGNGGLYRGLYESRIIDDFRKRGIEHVHAYCVDNILVKVADPLFIGYSAINKYDIATKVVRKLVPSEKVGLIVLDQKARVPCVIEYSEISKELSEMKDPKDPKLLYFRAANIVNHYYNVEFLDRMIPEWIGSRRHLPYHIARKKVKCLDMVTGKLTSPTEPNGLKMEQFIFDIFPSVKLEKFGCLEVERDEEFSPLKNAPGTGSNCAETCREDCLKRSTKWVVDAGGEADGLVEVSPLTSYDGEGLEFVRGHKYEGDVSEI